MKQIVHWQFAATLVSCVVYVFLWLFGAGDTQVAAAILVVCFFIPLDYAVVVGGEVGIPQKWTCALYAVAAAVVSEALIHGARVTHRVSWTVALGGVVLFAIGVLWRSISAARVDTAPP